MISDEKLAFNLIKCSLYEMRCFSLENFSLSLDSLIIMFLSVDHFEFILLGTFWMCRFIPFTKFGKFWPLFLQIFFQPLFLSSPYGTLHVGMLDGVPKVS